MSDTAAIQNTDGAPATVETLRKDLSALGVAPGITLLLHSSLSRLVDFAVRWMEHNRATAR